MNKFLMGAAAFAMMLPGAAMAAQDGTPGATSTGNFIASLQVNAPAGTTVEVIGLDDFNFPAVTGQITLTTPVPSMQRVFCINRSTPGDVLFTLNQTDRAPGSGFNLNDGNGGSIPLGVVLLTPLLDLGYGLSSGSQVTVVQSGPGCTEASNNAVGHTLELSPSSIPAQSGASYGSYSAQFTVVVSPQ